ncbi:hypothetical protein [Clostridium lundense]|uniref:hypothetical protein n=1 Tax=Clostridium lundense TaxID=319475 RepID=UPI0006891203|nr:hypothetical protein [Clostridium lundense]
MRIGATSNTIFNTMGMGLRANNHSKKSMSPLEKQKLQLQEQIKKVQESKYSEESKKSSIKGLEKKLEEVDDQLAKGKFVKKTKELEMLKPKDEKVEHQKVAGESEESSQVINKDVMIGITSATAHTKIGKIAYSVYRQAEAKGDTATAERALSYTGAELKKSAEGRRLIERGMKEYKKQMEIAKRSNTEKVTNDKDIRENDVVSKEEKTITNEVYGSNTQKVVTSENSEAKSSVKERLQ